MPSKELEWTVIFDFPSNKENTPGYYPTCHDGFTEIDPNNVISMDDCRVWTDKKEAEKFAKSKCGKYSWRLMPTKVEIVEYQLDKDKYNESSEFTDDSFYR